MLQKYNRAAVLVSGYGKITIYACCCRMPGKVYHCTM